MVKSGRLAVACLLLVGLTSLVFADFPFNGSFEQLDRGGPPVGWDLQGTWLSFSTGAYEGARALYLPGTVAQAGDRIVSQGYRLVSPGDTLTLHLAYIAVQGGAVVGVQPCDALGAPLGDKPLTVSLPPSADWRPVDQPLALAPAACPPGTAAVRVVLGVDTAGHEVKYDAVQLTCAGACGVTSCLPPQLNACARPNLLQNPTFKRGADGATPGWTPLGPAAAPSAGAAPVGLALVAGNQPVAWLSSAVPVDLSLPYEATLPLPDTCPAAARLTFLARLRDPADPQVILVQSSRAFCAFDAGPLSLLLPRLARTPRAGLADVAVTLRPGAGETVTLTSAALCPQPVTMGVRTPGMADEFSKPKAVTIFVVATNNTLGSLVAVAHMKVFDSAGQLACSEERPLSTIGPQSMSSFPYKPKLTAPGDYHLVVRLAAGGQDVGSASFVFKVTGME